MFSVEEQPSIWRRLPVVTLAVGIACVAMAVLPYVVPSLSKEVLWSNGANQKALTFSGEWWRLLSCAFLHADPIHLIMNLICLYQLGSMLEHLAGRAAVAFTFVVTAIAGSVCSALVHPDSFGVGASGGVFGLAGALYAFIWLAREPLGIDRSAAIAMMTNGLTFVGINFLYSLQPGVDMMAHFGGLASGAAIGAVLAFLLVARLAARGVVREFILGTATLLAVAALLVCSVPWGRRAAFREMILQYSATSPLENGAFDGLLKRIHTERLSDSNVVECVTRELWPAEIAAREALERLDVSIFSSSQCAIQRELLEISQMRQEGLDKFRGTGNGQDEVRAGLQLLNDAGRRVTALRPQIKAERGIP